MKYSNKSTMEYALIFTAAALLLSFLMPLRTAGQNMPGPMNGTTPSDQAPAAAPTRSTAQIAGKPNLAGTWKLNSDQSDNPMQKMREARQESGEQGGGFGRRGGGMNGGGGMGGGGVMGSGGMGSGGGMGGGESDGSNQQNGGGRRRGGMQAMGQLVIEQTPTSAKVSDSSGRVMALYLAPSEQGGSQSSSSAASNGDGNAAPVAQWQDSKLVATVNMRNGGTTTRTYEMSPDNKQLIATTKIQNQRLKEPVTIRQVYDPVYANTGGE